MPSRDAETRVLEHFLRTMAPPAALTATYRQRSFVLLDARSQVLSIRQVQHGILAAVVACVVLLAPGYVLTHAARTWVFPAYQLDTVNTADAVAPALGSMSSAVDGFELSIIQFQLQSRADAWIAAQQASRR